MATVAGWVESENAYGLRVGSRWVPWALGAPPRPWLGEYAEVQVDDEGFAVDVDVRGWRPGVPDPN